MRIGRLEQRDRGRTLDVHFLLSMIKLSLEKFREGDAMGIRVRSVPRAELGNSAHVVIEQDSGVAVVIDPARDVDQYLAVAADEHAELTWALETHVHNDFVSGARELVTAASAQLGASRDAKLRYPDQNSVKATRSSSAAGTSR